jgi:predicted dehydrogenase
MDLPENSAPSSGPPEERLTELETNWQMIRSAHAPGPAGQLAMRELIGRPKKVAAATMWRQGGYLVALLDYGDFVVTYETGVDKQVRFDAHIEVYGEQGSMRVQYDTPYVRHLPTTLVTERTVGDAYERSVLRPHLKDPYTHELEYFHQVVTEGGTPKTTPEDYVADMELFIELVRTMEKES